MRLKINRTAVWCLMLLLIVTVTSPLWLTWLINTAPVKAKLAAALMQKTSHQVKIRDFHVHIFPQPKIIFSAVTFTTAKIQGQILLRELGIGFDFLPLIKGQLIIDRIDIQHPEIDPELFDAVLNDQGISERTSFALPDPQSIFSILDLDQDQLSIHINDVQSDFFGKLNGSLTMSRSQSTIAVNAVIERLSVSKRQLSRFADIPVSFSLLNVNQVKLTGILNRRAEFNGHLSVVSPVLYSSDDVPLFKADHFDVAFFVKKGECQVSVSPFQAEYPTMNFGMELALRESEKESRLDFSGTGVDVRQVRQSALSLFNDDDTVQTLFDVLHSGHVPQVKVSFKSNFPGALLDQHKLTLSGNIQDGTVEIPRADLTAQQVNGKASISSGILHIGVSQGLIGQSRIESGTLDIDLMNYEDYPFTGRFNLNADLSEIPATLISLLPDTLLAQELGLVKNLSGRCSARLDLLLETESDDLEVHVESRPFSVTGRYERIPGVIELQDTVFIYHPDQIRIPSVSGLINGSRIRDIDFSMEIKDTAFFQIKKGAADIQLDSFIPWLMKFSKPRDLISPVNSGIGQLSVDHIQLSGPLTQPEEWKFHITGKGHDIHLASNSDQYDIASLACDFNLENGSSQFIDLSGTFNTRRLFDHTEAGSTLNELKFPVSVRQGRFTSAKEKTILEGQLFFGNGVQVFFNLNNTASNTIVVHRIEIVEPEVTAVTIQFPIQKGFSGLQFDGKLNTSTLHHIFHPDGYWASLLNRLTQKKPMIIESHDKSQFLVTTTVFDVDTLLSSFEGNSKSSPVFPQMNIQFQGDKVIFKRFAFTDVYSKIDISPSNVYVRVNQANLCDLSTRGYFSFKNNMVYTDMPFTAVDQPDLQSLIYCLLGKNKLMDGRYSLISHLSAGAPAQTVYSHFNGNIEFKSFEGRIYKLTLLSRILSILNVSKMFKGKIPDINQEGFAYNNVILEADIKDSLVYLKKAIVDGRDMTLIFAGTIDIAKDKLNLDCLVAPFKTVDMIIEKIPIINTLFSGRLISVPVKITGKMADPTVVPLHPTSVGKGLIDMMTDILKTPVRLFDKFSNEDQDSKDE